MSTKGPKKHKAKKSIEFLIPANHRHEFIDDIISQITEETIQTTGTVFKLKAKNSDITYHIIVSKNSTTGEIEYHAYDPKFEKLKLGKGAQGEVVIAQNLITGALVAVKCQQTYGFNDEVTRERENLLRVKQLIGTAVDEESIEYTIMEYNRGYNLLDKLYNKDKTKDRESVEYFSKKELNFIEKAELICLTLEAIIWLHEDIGIVHRDIKPDNLILLERLRGNKLKFVDFGSAIDPKTMTAKNIAIFKQFVGTFGYAPPELNVEQSKREPYSFASDIFALGIVIAEILTCHNYQAALRTHRLKQQGSDTSEELSLDDIKKMMPDAFKCENLRVLPSEQKLLEELLALISLCTNTTIEFRPSIDNVKKYLPSLVRKIDQLKMTQLESAEDRFAKYKQLKRQNSVLLLSDAQLATPQVEEKGVTFEKQAEEKEKSAKKSSTKTKSKREHLKRSSSVSKLKDKVKKSCQSEPEKFIVTTEPKCKTSEKLDEEKLKKRSMSSASAAQIRKSKSKTGTNHGDILLSSVLEESIPSDDDVLDKMKQLSLNEVKSNVPSLISGNIPPAFQVFPSIESDPEVINASLGMLSQRLSTTQYALTQSASASDAVAIELQPKDKMILAVFRQKLEHVRQTSSDKKAFRQSLTELDSLSSLAQKGSALDDQATAVKSTCAKLLKKSKD
ncbi:MAG: serine/threonine-protein kinase [Gammaproteobacteria bacterium]|jgi:serine/threonine protein kinase|nr:serine/threonine-protein kinase [Gammaproteobacteria bacterium]